MQEGADVIDMRARKGGESLPVSPCGRSRITQGQLVFGLVECGIRRIEICVERREGGECAAFTDYRTGWYIADDAQVRIYAELPGAEIERAAVEQIAIGDLFAPVGESEILAVDAEGLAVRAQLRQRKGGGTVHRAVAAKCHVCLVGALARRVVQHVHHPDE